MGIPLSRVLHDFGVAPQPAHREGQDAATPATVHAPAESLAARLEEAFARGEAAGRAAAAAEHEAALAAFAARARAEAEAEAAAEGRRLVEEQAERLAEALSRAIAEVESRISDAVAGALAPFLAAGLRERMIDELAEAVGRLASGGRAIRMRISGPEDLIAALRDRVGSALAEAEWVLNEDVDVRIVADDTLIESDIGAWAERFAGALR